MFSHMTGIDITYGFLIVRTYARLYFDLVGNYELTRDFYAIPRIDRKPEESLIQYRGIDREALCDFDERELFEEVLGEEINQGKRCSDDFLFNIADVQTILRKLHKSEEYELIWARLADSNHEPPTGFMPVGFEPTYFLGDHFSASCDCMLFPRWHGSDKDGILFLEHFKKLNKFGLFNSAADASAFLEYYLSFDWTEIGRYEIAEIFIRE